MMRILTLTLTLTALFQIAKAQNVNTLSVKIDNIAQAKGDILVALHKEASSFTDNPQNAYRFQKVARAEGAKTVSINFKNVPSGVYAVSVLQDMNNNKKMDFTGIGIPKEGFGVSNGPKSKFKKPQFDQSKFEVKANPTHITIGMMYF
jgi:uncharacterized protein (DUF2141 family)